ncbi:hypothetical protein TNCV_24951 [Trichonephila clavipes]|uniref:Uncharacterized protein n=1 Tax=Trichonephila clavipes TaxID=2585209 RepID=A0A8X7BDC3_TRICX|nr:hypothetical protein TNCV_24951 [Trichonephila clavipes]
MVDGDQGILGSVTKNISPYKFGVWIQSQILQRAPVLVVRLALDPRKSCPPQRSRCFGDVRYATDGNSSDSVTLNQCC